MIKIYQNNYQVERKSPEQEKNIQGSKKKITEEKVWYKKGIAYEWMNEWKKEYVNGHQMNEDGLPTTSLWFSKQNQ